MVFLVGAGPGDPELITVKGLRALRQADVVLYDRLSSPDLLAEVPESATLVDVGKRPRDPNQPSQSWINEQLITYGRTHDTVVRLKGGDPYVFGRGSEELAALTEAGIPCTVIPGISSAIAGPGAAGIPVTHRGVANSFGVFTGHEASESGDNIPWQAAALLPTAVFLMGVERLPTIVNQLIAHGCSPSTPVSIISSATLPNQLLIRGTLQTIVPLAVHVTPPAVIVVGKVAAFGMEEGVL